MKYFRIPIYELGIPIWIEYYVSSQARPVCFLGRYTPQQSDANRLICHEKPLASWVGSRSNPLVSLSNGTFLRLFDYLVLFFFHWVWLRLHSCPSRKVVVFFFCLKSFSPKKCVRWNLIDFFIERVFSSTNYGVMWFSLSSFGPFPLCLVGRNVKKSEGGFFDMILLPQIS